ncbi:MAG: 16S rRNA (adenine(1518)-N(6)/adenine(1519)-N(6))-dimethyltransferase RsmA [Actinomycetales bacterium]
MGEGLLGPSQVRALAQQVGVRPTKTRGQNFVVDANTVRRIVREARLTPGEQVLEVGPGLGSLTLALLEAGHPVTAVEIDPVLAGALPATVSARLPGLAEGLRLITADALQVDTLPEPQPTALVANLPYNVAVPILLTLLARFESLTGALVMVQAEVADRLVAGPGSRTYGAPSAKIAWYGTAERVGEVSRSVFWPVPNVDSTLVRVTRGSARGSEAERDRTFAVVDAAFAQRRKTLRAALTSWAGSASRAQHLLEAAGVDPGWRGERLTIDQFHAIAAEQECPTST